MINSVHAHLFCVDSRWEEPTCDTHWLYHALRRVVTHTHSLDIDLQQSPMGDCVERRKTHSLIAFWSCEVEGEWWEGGVTSQSNRPTDKGVQSDWEVEKPINLE